MSASGKVWEAVWPFFHPRSFRGWLPRLQPQRTRGGAGPAEAPGRGSPRTPSPAPPPFPVPAPRALADPRALRPAAPPARPHQSPAGAALASSGLRPPPAPLTNKHNFLRKENKLQRHDSPLVQRLLGRTSPGPQASAVATQRATRTAPHGPAARTVTPGHTDRESGRGGSNKGAGTEELPAAEGGACGRVWPRRAGRACL